jgi:hypothetical protein
VSRKNGGGRKGKKEDGKRRTEYGERRTEDGIRRTENGRKEKGKREMVNW